MKWSYGVTTVNHRFSGRDLLETLSSLKNAGFDAPRLFVDGSPSIVDRSTARIEKIGCYGNWLLALVELFLREPNADRYAIFQDDIRAVWHLREYLESVPYPDKGYLSLYTKVWDQPDKLAEGGMFGTPSDVKPHTYGFYPSEQCGRSALGLVFNREAVLLLLTQRRTYERIADPVLGHRHIDGACINAFKSLGWTEYVHNPSLLQHADVPSTLGHDDHEPCVSFPGEDWDAMQLLKVESR